MTQNGTLPLERNAILSAPLRQMFCCPRCEGLSDDVLDVAREATRQSTADLKKQLARWAEGEAAVPLIESLTGVERKLFTALWIRRGTVVPYGAVHRVIYGYGIEIARDSHRIRVSLGRLRVKIRPLGYRITTITQFGLRLEVAKEIESMPETEQ